MLPENRSRNRPSVSPTIDEIIMGGGQDFQSRTLFSGEGSRQQRRMGRLKIRSLRTNDPGRSIDSPRFRVIHIRSTHQQCA